MTTDRKAKAEWVLLAAFGVFAVGALALAALFNPDSHRESLVPVFAVSSGLLAIISLLAHMGLRVVRKARAAVPELSEGHAMTEETNKWKKPDGEPLFVAVSKDNEQMNAARQRGRATLPRFLEAIRSPEYASATNAVKIRIRDEQQSAEHGEDCFVFLWVWNVKEDGPNLRANVLELPREKINDLVVGGDVLFPREQVHDWMITLGPTVWGAFTMRVVRDRMDATEREQYDGYTGLTAYQEEMP